MDSKYCEHANETPQRCPCAAFCPCRAAFGMCRNQPADLAAQPFGESERLPKPKAVRVDHATPHIQIVIGALAEMGLKLAEIGLENAVTRVSLRSDAGLRFGIPPGRSATIYGPAGEVEVYCETAPRETGTFQVPGPAAEIGIDLYRQLREDRAAMAADVAFSFRGTVTVSFNRHGAAPLVWSINGSTFELAVREVVIETTVRTSYAPKSTPDDEDGKPSAFLVVAGLVTVRRDGTASITP